MAAEQPAVLDAKRRFKEAVRSGMEDWGKGRTGGKGGEKEQKEGEKGSLSLVHSSVTPLVFLLPPCSGSSVFARKLVLCCL